MHIAILEVILLFPIFQSTFSNMTRYPNVRNEIRICIGSILYFLCNLPATFQLYVGENATEQVDCFDSFYLGVNYTSFSLVIDTLSTRLVTTFSITISGAVSLILFRFLLGVSEAGLAPALMLCIVKLY